MTTKELINYKRQILVRLDSNLDTQRIVLSIVFSNLKAYISTEANKHIRTYSGIICGIRNRQQQLHREIENLESKEMQ